MGLDLESNIFFGNVHVKLLYDIIVEFTKKNYFFDYNLQ